MVARPSAWLQRARAPRLAGQVIFFVRYLSCKGSIPPQQHRHYGVRPGALAPRVGGRDLHDTHALSWEGQAKVMSDTAARFSLRTGRALQTLLVERHGASTRVAAMVRGRPAAARREQITNDLRDEGVPVGIGHAVAEPMAAPWAVGAGRRLGAFPRGTTTPVPGCVRRRPAGHGARYRSVPGRCPIAAAKGRPAGRRANEMGAATSTVGGGTCTPSDGR